MNDPQLSVIIPTYNRCYVLALTLQALEDQSIDNDRFEIIVVDDGSSDQTGTVVRKAQRGNDNLHYLSQAQSGPAAARNLGVKHARAPIVLLIGDDTIPHSQLIEQHLLSHKDQPENTAILGFTTWHQKVKQTPFIRMLDRRGMQFNFSGEGEEYQPSFRNFYTSNISLKKSFMLEHGLFDEEFPYAAYEDLELGYRLEKAGLKIIFNKNAETHHFHQATLNSYCRRSYQEGFSLAMMLNKHPDCGLGGFVSSKPGTLRRVAKAIILPILRRILSGLDYYGGVDCGNWYDRALGYYRENALREATKTTSKATHHKP